MFITSDGEADGADAGIEVENFVSGDVALDFGESHLIDWEVDLEEAIGRIGIFVTQDSICEIIKNRMGLAVFIEATRNLARLVAA